MLQPTRLISTPFAQEGDKTEIQNVTGEFDNSATYRLGFPPLTMQSIRSGGKPPKGTDFNGVLFDITENISFLCKGGRYQYNSGLSTLIGGYPEGSNLLLDDNVTEVVSTVAGNQNNPNINMTGWILKPNKTTAVNVADASGETQQQVNYNGGAKWHSRVGGYQENERVVLANGDIVKSTIDGNPANPNIDMTGWVKTNSTSQIFDESGLNQQEVNNGVTTIADLLAITNPKNGNRVYVKGYRAATNLALAKPYKGGGDFVFISENAGVNNGITIFNGWTRLGITDNVTPEMAGAYANDINSDADAFDIAIQYAHSNGLQVHALSETYYIDREVNVLTGKSYGTQGTMIKGAGKAKTFIRIAKDVDCFNLTNIDQLNFATNVRITDLSFTQTGDALNTGVALKTNTDLTNVILDEISFFECKQAVKFPNQFYIARLTSLHAQGCTYGFELGREGTTLFLDNLFVTGGGGASDSFAYKVRASYTTIGSLACDDFIGISYDFQYGQYFIGALGLETLHGNGQFANISFYQTHFRIENIEIVNANNLIASDLIMFAGDSTGSIGNIDTINTAATSPAQLFKSTNSTVDVGGVSGATTYAKSTYADQANLYGIKLQGLRYQRGDMRPFLGLGNTNLPDQLTSHANPCKQSILFDAYGAGFNYSGYAGDQDWQWFPAPNLGDWAIQRRPELFGIAATVSLADGGVNNDRTQDQEGVIPLVVFVKPNTPAAGCIYINTETGKVEMYSGTAWLLLN